MKASQLLIKSLAGTLIFLFILFFSAGRINYWQGWLYASVNIACLFLNSYALGENEELAEERSKVRSDTKSWDKKILALSALVLIITYVVAGLDSGRYLWSSRFHWSVHASGVILLLLGEALFLSAQKENKFFSSVVRIQSDRGHTVCDTGVYKTVRHPAYSGMIATAIGIPLILGSLWCFIPAVCSILLTVIRTSLEDKTLVRELNGYSEYVSRTPSRLIPHVW